jgi:hypothetical protein
MGPGIAQTGINPTRNSSIIKVTGYNVCDIKTCSITLNGEGDSLKKKQKKKKQI